MTSTNECEGSFVGRLCSSVFLVFICCLIPVVATAAPVITGDTTGTASLLGAGGTASFSFNHTTDAGVQRMLLVGISLNITNSTTTTVTNVTYNGVSLTRADAQSYNNTRRVEIWRPGESASWISRSPSPQT